MRRTPVISVPILISSTYSAKYSANPEQYKGTIWDIQTFQIAYMVSLVESLIELLFIVRQKISNRL